MHKRLGLLLAVVLIFVVFGAPRQANAYYQQSWGSIVDEAWQAYQQRFIFCGEPCGNNLGLVFDPAIGYQATSESSGYGMLMAVMMNDQATFNVIYNATYTYLYKSDTGLFHWRADNTGVITGEGSASDADIDIAAALVFASNRVERGDWNAFRTRPYQATAARLIDSIYVHDVVDGRYLKPGDQFGGEGTEIINLSYFSPAWFVLFDEFQGTVRWQPIIEQGYQSLSASPGADIGLAPDWSRVDGQPADEFCGQIGRDPFACDFQMRYDGIRVPWRQGVHCLWNQDQRACSWVQRGVSFLNTLPDPVANARFFDMQGNVTADYQDTVMVSMWMTAVQVDRDYQLLAQFYNEFEWNPSVGEMPGYFGSEADAEDYFQQSLGWFAAALQSGDFRYIR